jgi:hypothetical protein
MVDTGGVLKVGFGEYRRHKKKKGTHTRRIASASVCTFLFIRQLFSDKGLYLMYLPALKIQTAILP